MRLRHVLTLALVLGLAALAEAPIAAPTPSESQIPFTASLVAATHTPEAGTRWTYTVYARDRRGKRLHATVSPVILYNGKKVDTVGYYAFVGIYRGSFRWSDETRSKPLVFQVRVIAKSRVLKLDYVVRVR